MNPDDFSALTATSSLARGVFVVEDIYTKDFHSPGEIMLLKLRKDSGLSG
jgi:hypothetical protein